jgi:hypothetical protein
VNQKDLVPTPSSRLKVQSQRISHSVLFVFYRPLFLSSLVFVRKFCFHNLILRLRSWHRKTFLANHCTPKIYVLARFMQHLAFHKWTRWIASRLVIPPPRPHDRVCWTPCGDLTRPLALPAGRVLAYLTCGASHRAFHDEDLEGIKSPRRGPS